MPPTHDRTFLSRPHVRIAVATALCAAWLSPARAQEGGCQTATGCCWGERVTYCVGGTEDRQPCDLDEPFLLSACAIGGGTCQGVPGCDDAACCEAVCNIDFYCCDTSWDRTCAAVARNVCVHSAPTPNDECWSSIPGGGATVLAVPSTTWVARRLATSTESDPSFCCKRGSPDGRAGHTVWFRFTAPTASPGETTSAVAITLTATENCKWCAGTLGALVQVFSVDKPDAGICSDSQARCSLAAQDCEVGTGPCVFDEAHACAGLTTVACKEPFRVRYDENCDGPNPPDFCLGRLIPGATYFILLASADDSVADRYALTIAAEACTSGADADCNANGLPDDCDALAGSSDENRNTVPDECELLGDCDGSAIVDLNDARTFAQCVTGPWGLYPFRPVLPFDACACAGLNGDWAVDLRDMAAFAFRFDDIR